MNEYERIVELRLDNYRLLEKSTPSTEARSRLRTAIAALEGVLDDFHKMEEKRLWTPERSTSR